MIRMLRRATAAALAALLTLGPLQLALADGRTDWPRYAWQQVRLAACLPVDQVLHCPPYHQKWDWKRNQWVDIAIEIDLRRGALRLTQRLTNKDPRDSDFVCVTVLALDAGGRNLIAHHQNWHMKPGQVREDSFAYRSSRLETAATIQIGSRQCRIGAGEDDARYQQVLAGIEP